MENIEELNNKFNTPEELLSYFIKEYKGHIALASSLSIEDQVLTDMICSIDKNVEIFTLDTGRLFPETYSLIERTNMNYGIKIHVFFPQSQAVESMVQEHGVNLFYNSIENRHLCCQVRKLEPLSRAFKGLKVWICGLRKSQSVTRVDEKMVEWDAMHNMIKINPIVNWSEEMVWERIRKNGIPYNKLHEMGFPSIGCQPCTRAVKPGEDVRSGRWWWESPEHRECGLHKQS